MNIYKKATNTLGYKIGKHQILCSDHAMDHQLFSPSDNADNLGSLIRASIDIDAWISHGRMELDGHETPDNINERDFDSFQRNLAENSQEHAIRASWSQCSTLETNDQLRDLVPWNSECLEKESGALRIRASAASCTIGNVDNPEDAKDEKIQELTPRTGVGVDFTGNQFEDQQSWSDRGEIGSVDVTMDKTPKQTRYEDLMNEFQESFQTCYSTRERNSDEVETAMERYSPSMTTQSFDKIVQRLPSFRDTFPNKWYTAYVQTEGQWGIAKENERMQKQSPRSAVICYKCRDIIEPRDWIRYIDVEGITEFYHMKCFYCDYCKAVLCTDQYYTLYQGKLLCNFDFRMLTTLRKDSSKKRLVVLHIAKKEMKKNLRISHEQKLVLQRALRNIDRSTLARNAQL